MTGAGERRVSRLRSSCRQKVWCRSIFVRRAASSSARWRRWPGSSRGRGHRVWRDQQRHAATRPISASSNVTAAGLSSPIDFGSQPMSGHLFSTAWRFWLALSRNRGGSDQRFPAPARSCETHVELSLARRSARNRRSQLARAAPRPLARRPSRRRPSRCAQPSISSVPPRLVHELANHLLLIGREEQPPRSCR